ncbi:MAG: redoxin domain-containing protein [Candidatus Kapabacteria bacterium]|nr:redoxin domain-containing protein [Candidatus Kapabacteria bacterium]
MKPYIRHLAILILALVAQSVLMAQTTSVSGTLLGADGKPMKVAHIMFRNVNSTADTAERYAAKPDGKFSTAVKNGLYTISFAGVDHKQSDERIMLFCNGEPVRLNAKLAANTLPKDLDSVFVITDADNFSFGSATPMKKQADGTYTLSIQAAGKTLGYQIIPKGKKDDEEGVHSINGTTASRYEYDGGGDYRSYMDVKNGMVNLTFNPASFPAQSGKFSIEYESESTKRIDAVMKEMQDARRAMMQVMFAKRANKTPTVNEDSLRTALLKAITDDKNAMTREIRYVMLADLTMYSTDSAWSDMTMLKNLFATVPPASPSWELSPAAPQAIANRRSEFTAYTDRLLGANPSDYVKSNVLLQRITKANADKNEKALREAYTALVTQYPTTNAAERAIKEYNPDRGIMPGKMIPDFSFDDVQNPGQKITPAMLRGKWVLIDNWATWCGPCVMEMPELHKTYEKFKDKNFTILSVSFDASVKDIAKFRDGKWKMPWLHAFSEGVWKNDAAKIFEVSGIPKPILIDPTGKIVTLQGELRGDALEKTISEYVK